MIIEDHDLSEMAVPEREKLRRYDIGFVFQSVALIPIMNAYENVDFGLRLAEYEGNRDSRIREVLEMVGLSSRMFHMPNQMSGGQMQRLAVVVSDICGKELLVFDEPTSGLDLKSMEEVGILTRSLATQGKVLLIITHDIEFMMQICTRILFIRDGEIVEDLSGGQKEKIVRLLRGEE